LKDLRWLLIEADVSLPVVNELVERLREKLKPQTGIVSPQDYLLKTVYEELTALLGSYRPLKVNPRGISLYVLAGLQGSGKTTTAAKLGYFLNVTVSRWFWELQTLIALPEQSSCGCWPVKTVFILSRLWKTVKSTLRRFKVS